MHDDTQKMLAYIEHAISFLIITTKSIFHTSIQVR